MWSLFLALTWTAVAAGPLFQTATLGSGKESELQEATLGSVFRQMAPELQEATPGSVLRLIALELQEATPGSVLREMAPELQEATPGSVLREMAPKLQEATPGSVLQEMTTELQEATPGSVLREMAPELQEATPGSVLQEMTTELQEATPGSVLREMAPKLQEATPGSVLQEMTTELQEATDGSVLQEMTTELQEATDGSVFREITPGLQEATPGSVLREMAPELQEATPGSVLQQISDDINVDQYLRTYGYLNDMNEHAQNYNQRRTEALKSFQRFAGLQITGVENEETRQKMLQPRCGMKDIELFRPSNVKWNITEFTYGFESYTKDLRKEDVRNSIRDALNEWSGASKLTFKIIESGTPIIEIRFVTGHHPPCDFDADGPGKALAHAFLPSSNPRAGDIHFDDAEHYFYQEGTGRDLTSVALHEAGHSLGLSHDYIQSSIMFPWYSGKTKLGPNDIARIKKLYA